MTQGEIKRLNEKEKEAEHSNYLKKLEVDFDQQKVVVNSGNEQIQELMEELAK